MKLKNAEEQQVVIKGFCIEVVKQNGYMSIQSGPGYPYVVPDGYVMATCNDDNADEFYIIAHKNMFAGDA